MRQVPEVEAEEGDPPSPQLVRNSLRRSLNRSLFNTLALNSEHGEHFALSPINSHHKPQFIYTLPTPG